MENLGKLVLCFLFILLVTQHRPRQASAPLCWVFIRHALRVTLKPTIDIFAIAIILVHELYLQIFTGYLIKRGEFKSVISQTKKVKVSHSISFLKICWSKLLRTRKLGKFLKILNFCYFLIKILESRIQPVFTSNLYY